MTTIYSSNSNNRIGASTSTTAVQKRTVTSTTSNNVVSSNERASPYGYTNISNARITTANTNTNNNTNNNTNSGIKNSINNASGNLNTGNNVKILNSNSISDNVQGTKNNNTQNSSTQNKSNLLEQYTHTLQHENTAKTLEIKVLREELAKNQSSKLSSSTTNIVTSCSNCSKKQSEITTLNKYIKQLQEKHDSEIKKIRTTTYVNTNNNKYTNDEYEKLKALYQEARRKNQQNQRVQWTTIKVDQSNSNYNELQRKYNSLAQQNTKLLARIQHLQYKLSTQHNVSHSFLYQHQHNIRTDRETPIISSNHPVIKTQLPTQVPQYQQLSHHNNFISQPGFVTNVRFVNQIQQPVINTNISGGKSVTFRLPQIQEHTNQYALRHSSSNLHHEHQRHRYSHPFLINDGYNSQNYHSHSLYPYPHPHPHHNHNNNGHHYAYQYLPQSHYHLSPLTILTPTASQIGLTGTNLLSNDNHVHGNSNLYTNNSYRYDGEYYKNIVEERQRSLQHKINILQQQNNKLRAQVNTNTIHHHV